MSIFRRSKVPEQMDRAPLPAQVRDPRAATLRTQFVGLRSAMVPDWDAENSILEGYYANIYVYACARARASDLAARPLRVGADPDKPTDFDPRHPLAKLLGPAPGGPTTNISARRLMAWSIVQYDITGRLAWEIASPVANRRDGVPFELWPLPASRLRPKPSEQGGAWWSGFEYRTVHGYVRLNPEQVMYYWRPSQSDFREPESVLRAARLNVSVAVMQDRYDYAFLINDARPATVVVHEAFDEKPERDAFRRQFLEAHRGPDNAGKTAFVETSEGGALPKDALLIQQLGLSHRDGEFINRYENTIRAINVAFGVPLSRLADSSRRTYSNAEIEAKHYWRTTLNPLGVEIAEAVNIGLMPVIGDDSNVCWFDMTGVPELEPPRRWAVGDIPSLIEAEVININEGRDSLELPPRDGGDEFGSAEPPQPAPAAPPAMPEMPAPDRAPLRLVHTRSIVAADSQAAAMLHQVWRERVGRLLDVCRDATIRRAEGKRGRQAMDSEDRAAALLDPVFWYSQANSVFTDLLAQTYATAVVARQAAGLDVRHGFGSVHCTRWTRRRAHRMAQFLVEGLSDLINHGDSASQIGYIVDSAFGRFDDGLTREAIDAIYRSACTVIEKGDQVVATDDVVNALIQVSQGGDVESALALLH